MEQQFLNHFSKNTKTFQLVGKTSNRIKWILHFSENNITLSSFPTREDTFRLEIDSVKRNSYISAVYIFKEDMHQPPWWKTTNELHVVISFEDGSVSANYLRRSFNFLSPTKMDETYKVQYLNSI